MPGYVGGGGVISSSNIVDGTIVNADINSAAAIAASKLLGDDTAFAAGWDGVLTPASKNAIYDKILSLPVTAIYTASGTTLNINPNGSQVVVAFAIAEVQTNTAGMTLNILYNGSNKQTMNDIYSSNGFGKNMSVMYTETPASGAQNITVTSNRTINSCSIIAFLIG